MRRSVTTERGVFGALTTGIYSNADLVANYEGYRFYRGLFTTASSRGSRRSCAGKMVTRCARAPSPGRIT